MTDEEYIKLQDELKENYNQKVREVDRNYVLSNKIAGVDDFVTDHYQTVLVDKLSMSYNLSEFPECRYHGVKQTKYRKPFKSGERGCVYASNIKYVNGKEVFRNE